MIWSHKSFARCLALLLVAITALALESGCIGMGCGGAPNEVTCTTDEQCPTGSRCGFYESDACGATGMCEVVSAASESCSAQDVVGCGCDGADVTWQSGCSGLPEGSAPAPISHMGSCTQ
jgi:hypothetical protein